MFEITYQKDGYIVSETFESYCDAMEYFTFLTIDYPTVQITYNGKTVEVLDEMID